MRRTPAAVTLALALAAAPVLAASPAAAAAPTATITVREPWIAIGGTSLVTFTFSEAVTGLTAADVTATAGALSEPMTSDGGREWTAVFTPDPGITDYAARLVLDNAGVVAWADGTPGTGTTASNTFSVDTERPTATVAVSQPRLRAGTTSTVTLAFSEAVIGVDTADLTVGAGTVSGLSSSDGGLTWTATLTPAVDTEAPGAVVTLDLTGVQDLAGNVGAGSAGSPAYAVDTLRPTGVVTADRAVVRAGETATVTLTFSEPVSGAGGGAPGLALAAGGGTLTTPTSADGGRTWTATFTPDPDSRRTADLVLDLSTVADGAGNVGAGTTVPVSLQVSTVRPTATVAVSEPVLTTGVDAVLTLTFSEPVTVGLWRALSTPGASVPVLSSSDGGVTWTGPLTGAAGTESGPAVVTLDLAQVRNVDGNAGVGTATSGTYAVDTVRPTATLALAAARVTGPTTLTITFSEPVASLALTDLVAEAGTLSGLATADGGLTWTATYTPDAGARVGAATIRLALAGVTDLAGNAGVAAALSVPFAVEAPAAPGGVVPGVPVVVAPVAVPAAAPVAAAPSTPSATLPRTGSEAGPALVLAAGLLLAGAAGVGARGAARARRGRA